MLMETQRDVERYKYTCLLVLETFKLSVSKITWFIHRFPQKKQKNRYSRKTTMNVWKLLQKHASSGGHTVGSIFHYWTL